MPLGNAISGNTYPELLTIASGHPCLPLGNAISGNTYPELLTIASGHPCLPLGNAISGNTYFHHESMGLAKPIEFINVNATTVTSWRSTIRTMSGNVAEC